MDSIIALLEANESAISAIVGLLTLAAAVWGIVQLALLPLIGGLQRTTGPAATQTEAKRLNVISSLLNNGLNPLAELDEQIAVRTLNLAVGARRLFAGLAGRHPVLP